MFISQPTDIFFKVKYSGRFWSWIFFLRDLSTMGIRWVFLYWNRPRWQPFPRELCSHHRKSRGCLCRNRPSRERFPRQPATVGTSHHGNSRLGFNCFFSPERVYVAITPDVSAPFFFVSLQPLIINTFAWMIPEIYILVSCKHLIVYAWTAHQQEQHKLGKAKQVLRLLVGTYSRSQTMRAGKLWRSDRGVQRPRPPREKIRDEPRQTQRQPLRKQDNIRTICIRKIKYKNSRTKTEIRRVQSTRRQIYIHIYMYSLYRYKIRTCCSLLVLPCTKDRPE